MRRVRTHLDWPLLLGLLAIAAIGLLNLYIATVHAPKKGLFNAQVSWMLVGLGAFEVTALIDYRLWLRFAWAALIIGLVAIVAVHFVGVTVKGSRRWLGVGGVGVQPSEFIKIAVILAMARLAHDASAEESTPDWRCASK